MYPNSNCLKAFALGVVLVSAASAARADKDRDSTESSLIIDTTAPPLATTKEQWRRGEKLQQEIWSHAIEHTEHIRQGDQHFKEGKYREALREYTQAAQKAAISPELLQAKRRIAGTLEALGNFSEALLEVEVLIQQTLNEQTKGEYKLWKNILEEAQQQQYASAAQSYHKLLALVADWERPIIEQRLHLMEDRARAAGQQPSKETSSTTENSVPDE